MSTFAADATQEWRPSPRTCRSDLAGKTDASIPCKFPPGCSPVSFLCFSKHEIKSPTAPFRDYDAATGETFCKVKTRTRYSSSAISGARRQLLSRGILPPAHGERRGAAGLRQVKQDGWREPRRQSWVRQVNFLLRRMRRQSHETNGGRTRYAKPESFCLQRRL